MSTARNNQESNLCRPSPVSGIKTLHWTFLALRPSEAKKSELGKLTRDLAFSFNSRLGKSGNQLLPEVPIRRPLISPPVQVVKHEVGPDIHEPS